MATSREAKLRINAAQIIASVLGGNTITAATYSTGSVTATIGAHSIVVGNQVTIAGVTPSGYNGNYPVTAITPTTITYSGVAAVAAYSSGGKATTQVTLGRQAIEPSRKFYEKLLLSTSATQGPAALVLPAQNSPGDGQKRVYDIIIPIVMYFGSALYTQVTFTAAEDVWTVVRDAFWIKGNWTAGPPDHVAVRGPDTSSDGTPNVDTYTFELTFWGASPTQ